MTAIGSYTASVLGTGVPIYRFFAVEDADLNGKIDGFYVNVDNAANAVTPTSNSALALPTGALLPGNLVYVTTSTTAPAGAAFPGLPSVANPGVLRPSNTATSAVIASISGVQMGVVVGSRVFDYMPTDNATYQGYFTSVLRGRFTALMDLNSFEAGHSPTAIGVPIYPSSSGLQADQGLFSTVLVGSTNTAKYILGTVLGFETVTTYGGPGVQQTSTYSSSNGTQASAGGVTLVRVAFDIPYIPIP